MGKRDRTALTGGAATARWSGSWAVHPLDDGYALVLDGMLRSAVIGDLIPAVDQLVLDGGRQVRIDAAGVWDADVRALILLWQVFDVLLSFHIRVHVDLGAHQGNVLGRTLRELLACIPGFADLVSFE